MPSERLPPAKKFSPEDAGKYMAERGLEAEFTFDREYNERELKILAERKTAEMKRADILSRADGGMATAGRFGIMLATQLLDPLAVGSAFVPVVGGTRYAKLLAGASGALGRAGVRAGVGAAEGAVGAAIVEPLILAAKMQEQADYTAADSLLNIAIGSVFGGGLHVAGGAVGDALRAPRAAPAMEAPRLGVEPARLPQIETPGFREWFGESRVVDAEGKPLVVYHGTPTPEFDQFSPAFAGRNTGNDAQDVAYHFSDSTKAANYYADVGGPNGAVMPVYLTMRNPLISSESVINRTDIEAAKAAGHDGIIAPNATKTGTEYIAFAPSQVKSAIGNSGKFDPNSASLTDSASIVARADPAIREAALRSAVAQAATDQPIEARPVFDQRPETMRDAAARLSDPDQRPLTNPESVVRADAILAAGDRAELAAIEQQATALDEQIKAVQAEAKLMGDDATVTAIDEDMAQVAEIERQYKESTAQANMLAVCAARHAA
jgi:hypothetical protein